MPNNRSRLYLSKLDDFAAFAASRGYRREPVKGEYEALRLRRDGEAPLIYFRRRGCDHATVPWGPEERPGQLVAAYLRERRRA